MEVVVGADLNVGALAGGVAVATGPGLGAWFALVGRVVGVRMAAIEAQDGDGPGALAPALVTWELAVAVAGGGAGPVVEVVAGVLAPLGQGPLM